MEKYILETIKKESKGRKIVIWGRRNAESDTFLKNLITTHGSEVAFFVDSDFVKCDEETVFHPSIISGKNSDYYIVIPISHYDEIYNVLENYGYKETSDFLYINHQPIKLLQVYDYSDKYGNQVIGNFKNGCLEFLGYNSSVTIGKDFKFSGVIKIKSNCNIYIGDYVQATDSIWEFKDNCKVKIGNSVKIQKNGKLLVQENALLEIGQKTTIEDNSYFSIDIGTKCCLGEDNLVSIDSIFRTNDGHTIFVDGKNINSTPSINSNRMIKTGNHVWIGQRSTLLYNTDLGDGCIVGSNSLVKNKYEPACIVAGVPATIIKKNVEWSREKCSSRE